MKILIIAESIAPVQAVASIRWTKFAKYLAKNENHHVVILTNEKSFSSSSNDKALKLYSYDSSCMGDLHQVEVDFLPLSRFQRISNRLYNAASAQLAYLHNSEPSSSRKIRLKTDDLITVFEYLRVAADWLTGKALERVSKKYLKRYSSFDCVVSTYGPRWPHQIARRIKNIIPTIKWVADFRDPPVSSARNDNYFTRTYADKITRNADCVIGVSRGTVENLFLKHHQRAEVINNGFDIDDSVALDRISTDKFLLVYTGTLYADDTCLRDISPLFRMLQELIEEKRVARDDIQVLYAGTTPDLFLQAASKYPRIPAKSLGLLERSDVLSLQKSASALIVCTWNTEYQKGVLTGKIFEYMLAGTPILGLCSGSAPNSDLRMIIEGCQIGACFEEADQDTYDTLKKKILALYENWKRCGFTELPIESSQLIMRYSYPVLCKSLLRLLS